jgi:hypothetical protein
LYADGEMELLLPGFINYKTKAVQVMLLYDAGAEDFSIKKRKKRIMDSKGA